MRQRGGCAPCCALWCAPPMDAYQRAALVVENALHGRSVVAPTEGAAWAQVLYHARGYRLAYTAAAVGVVALTAWEPPAADAAVGGGLVAARCLDAAFLAAVAADLAVQAAYHGWRGWRARGWIRVKAAVWLAMVLNLVVVAAVPSAAYPVRVLRPLFLVERLRNVRRVAANVLATLPRIVNVLVLLVIHVLLFAVLGFVLFAGLDGANCTVMRRAAPPQCSTFGSGNCTDYFATVDNSAMQLFQLLTATNFPTVALPAYECNSASMLYFAAFSLVGTYLFLNLTLAVAYSGFKSSMEEEVLRKYSRTFQGCDVAFSVIVAARDGAADSRAVPNALSAAAAAAAASSSTTSTTVSPPSRPAADAARRARAASRRVDSGAAAGMLRAEFVLFFSELRPAIPPLAAGRFFDIFDADGRGEIYVDEFRRLILSFANLTVKVVKPTLGALAKQDSVAALRTARPLAATAPLAAGVGAPASALPTPSAQVSPPAPPAPPPVRPLPSGPPPALAGRRSSGGGGGSGSGSGRVLLRGARASGAATAAPGGDGGEAPPSPAATAGDDDDGDDDVEMLDGIMLANPSVRASFVGTFPTGARASTTHRSSLPPVAVSREASATVANPLAAAGTAAAGSGAPEPPTSPAHGGGERSVRVHHAAAAPAAIEMVAMDATAAARGGGSTASAANAMRTPPPGGGSVPRTPSRLLGVAPWATSHRRLPAAAPRHRDSLPALLLQSWWVTALFDAMIVVNVVAVMVELSNTADDTPVVSPAAVASQKIQYAVLAVFVFEVVAKVVVWGPRTYWRLGWWSRVDVVLVAAALVGTSLEASGVVTRQVATTASFARFMRLVRILRVVPGFEVTMGAFADIMPVVAQYATTLACIFVSFAITGELAFHGVLDPANPVVMASSYGMSGFTALNFDTLRGSLACNLYFLILNDWPVMFDALEAVLGPVVRLYFFAFWLVHVVLALNVVVAFIIDSFSAQKGKRERLAAIKAHANADHLGVEDWRALIVASGVDFSAYRISRKAHHFDVYDEVYKTSVREHFASTFASTRALASDDHDAAAAYD